MWIENDSGRYEVADDDVIDSSLSCCDSMNDIAGQYAADDDDFSRILEEASAAIAGKEGATFADFDAACSAARKRD